MEEGYNLPEEVVCQGQSCKYGEAANQEELLDVAVDVVSQFIGEDYLYLLWGKTLQQGITEDYPPGLPKPCQEGIGLSGVLAQVNLEYPPQVKPCLLGHGYQQPPEGLILNGGPLIKEGQDKDRRQTGHDQGKEGKD